MPKGDRTGPMGMGARTGRAAGLCSGAGTPGYTNPGSGRGFGIGFGWNRNARGCGAGGRGRRNMFNATGLPGWARFGTTQEPFQNNPEAEKQVLGSRAEALRSQLEVINQRLNEIETKRAAE